MRRTKDRARETRAAIIDAAERAFYENGVAETSMEHVALAAGVTRGAVHHYFDSKAHLFLEVVDAAAISWPEIERPLSSKDSEIDVLATLERRTIAWIDMFAANPQARRLVAIILRTTCSAELELAFDKVRRSHLMTFEEMTALFRFADSSGELADAWPPETARNAFVWMLCGLSSR